MLAALVVRHGRHLFALLSADMVSELRSAKQDKEDGSEVGGHKFHVNSLAIEGSRRH